MKKICVIGASSGIGKALSEYYKDHGDTVDTITRVSYDLSQNEDIKKLCLSISKKDYDFVIYSAGVGYHRKFEDLTADEISAQISVNTLAPLQLIHALPEGIKFIYISSIMQYIPAKNMSVYASMKRATSQALKTISLENSNRNILDIDLGAVRTPMHLKAGMKKTVGKEIDRVIPKIVHAIENKQGSTTLFWDWFLMIYIVFPLMRVFLGLKK